tara:strand:- start:891 stop:1061 length:171 start_codon:yes stop_codon:yes gene_type:complete
MGGSTEALGEVERMLDGVGQKFICDWRGVVGNFLEDGDGGQYGTGGIKEKSGHAKS